MNEGHSWTKLNQIEPNWAKMSQIWVKISQNKPSWAELSQFWINLNFNFELRTSNMNDGHIWTKLSLIEPNWAKLSKIQPNWANLSQFEPNWAKLSQFEPMWANFEPSLDLNYCNDVLMWNIEKAVNHATSRDFHGLQMLQMRCQSNNA